MHSRILKTGLLLLALTACTKDKETQAPAQPSPTASAGALASRMRPPAELPGPWQKKALRGQELYATLQTSEGHIVVRLFSKDAPLTVANFVGLATGEQGWVVQEKDIDGVITGKPLYQGVLFDRVVPGVMIQGGAPKGTDSGSPGYTFEDELQSGRRFDKPGLLAMANKGPNTNGSQFFITTSPPADLNGHHTIFGEVVTGYDVVERISKVPTAGQNKPVKDVVLEQVSISDAQPK